MGEVWFTLKGAVLSNNSLVTLDDIGEGDSDALHCTTDNTSCCQLDSIGQKALGNWFFPNGSRVPSSGIQWDFHRTRHHMAVLLHRRRGGEDGVYRCEIPDKEGIVQTTYIGVYTADTGEWYMYPSSYVAEERNLVYILFTNRKVNTVKPTLWTPFSCEVVLYNGHFQKT